MGEAEQTRGVSSERLDMWPRNGGKEAVWCDEREETSEEKGAGKMLSAGCLAKGSQTLIIPHI